MFYFSRIWSRRGYCLYCIATASLIFGSVNSSASVNDYSEPANRWCNKLGEICETFRESCAGKTTERLKNICIVNNMYLLTGVGEICKTRSDDSGECIKSLMISSVNAGIVELEISATKLGSAAVAACKPFYRFYFSTPSGEELSSFLEDYQKGSSVTYEWDKLLKCYEDQYRTMVKDSVK